MKTFGCNSQEKPYLLLSYIVWTVIDCCLFFWLGFDTETKEFPIGAKIIIAGLVIGKELQGDDIFPSFFSYRTHCLILSCLRI